MPTGIMKIPVGIGSSIDISIAGEDTLSQKNIYYRKFKDSQLKTFADDDRKVTIFEKLACMNSISL